MSKDPQDQFLQLYDEKSDAIFRHLYFRISDREKALDMMQETFERTWKYIVKGNEIDNMKAFLYRVANNLLIDEYRRRKQVASLDYLHEKGIEVGSGNKEKDAIYDRADVRLALQYVERLPEKDRHMIVMRYVDDLSIKEISEITDLPENNVSVRIHRALKKLQNNFELS